MRRFVIGVMGPGKEATVKDTKNAYDLGKLIAQNGWVLLSGGMASGVMGAANKGAKSKEGLTVGILPNDNPSTWSKAVDIAIVTNMRGGRNYIDALSSDVLIACGMSPGTATEVAHAIHSNKPIILLGNGKESKTFFKTLKGRLYFADTPKQAITIVKKVISNSFSLIEKPR